MKPCQAPNYVLHGQHPTDLFSQDLEELTGYGRGRHIQLVGQEGQNSDPGITGILLHVQKTALDRSKYLSQQKIAQLTYTNRNKEKCFPESCRTIFLGEETSLCHQQNRVQYILNWLHPRTSMTPHRCDTTDASLYLLFLLTKCIWKPVKI